MDNKDLLALVEFDGWNVLEVLKKGASAIWDKRHELFPKLAPIIDKGIELAKPMIAALGGSDLPNKIKDAIASDHTDLTTRATNMLSNTGNTIVRNLMGTLTDDKSIK